MRISINPSRSFKHLLLSALIGCVTVEPMWPDLTPLLSATIEQNRSLHELLPAYSPSGRSADSVLEALSIDTFTPRTDDRKSSLDVTVRVERFVSSFAAEESRKRICSWYAEMFADGEIRNGEEANSSWCSSPIRQLRNDPEGGYLPRDQYIAFAVVRRSDVVFEFWGTRTGKSGRILDDAVALLSRQLSGAKR